MSAAVPRRAALLRGAVAAVAAVDLLSLALFLGEARGRALTGGAPIGVFADTLSQLPVVLPVVAVGLAGALAFARAPGRIIAGFLPLVALSLLSAAHAQLFGSPWRHLFYSGLCLAGWLVGLLVVRRRGTPGDESYARTGALALLGAAYLNAGISKLVFGGGDWATSAPIQAVIIGQDGLIGAGMLHTYRTWVVMNPVVAAAFSVATVLFEVAAPLMLAGRRFRLAVAGGLFAMHFNILLLTSDILYWQAMLFLALFALAPDDSSADRAAPPSTGVLSTRGFATLAALLIGAAALGISHQAARFRQLDRPLVATGIAQPTPLPALQRLGPFAVGATLGEGWSIERLEPTERGFTVTLAGRPGRARFELSCAPSEHTSPFDLGPAHIFYSNDVPFAALAGAGNALRDVVRGAAADQDICAALETWRAAADP